MTEQVPITNVPTRVKLRVEDYLSLDRDGAFEDYGKTELIDGEVMYMNAQHRPHARAKIALYEAFKLALSQSVERLAVMVEASIDVPPHNVPEPDITLTSDPDGAGLIPLRSVRLVAEVADTTLKSDLTRKAAIYARHQVAEYRLVDVNGRIIHQLWSPADGAYLQRVEHQFGASVTAATMPT
ncbi:Uma2 family endonuclease [Sphingomonas sp.]|uniref:Uma2 family endonuclease n=1 Tax=Sphingomonas sp. TaxID=28214 RepID=UPI0035C790F7